MSSTDLKAAIVGLNLANKKIALHSALGSFGRDRPSPDVLIDAFLEVGTTLLVPTFSYRCEVGPTPGFTNNAAEAPALTSQVFDADLTPSSADMGIVPRTLLARPGRVRGNHPIDSLTALGPDATDIAGCQTPQEIYAPYQKLYDQFSQDSVLLLVGVGLTRATAVHFAEYRAGRRLFRRQGSTATGTVDCQVGGCSEGFDALESRVSGLERQFKVGDSPWRCFPFNAFVDEAVSAILEDPGLVHCGMACSRCDAMLAGGPVRDATGSAG